MKKQAWQAHVDAYNNSEQSPSAFVNKPKPSATAKVLGVLEFPNGIKPHLHSAERLNSIPNLWTGKS
jgi:hypothetical protein